MPKLEQQNHSLRLLFHMHTPPKLKPRNAVFLPLFMIRNQLVGVCMVALSFDPTIQIGVCGSLFLLFGVYSLACCPYRKFLRVCLHISDLVLVVQSVMLYLVVSGQYGVEYSPNNLVSNQGFYNFAWVLISLNYLQIVIYTVLGLGILFDFGKEKLCKTSSVADAPYEHKQ